MVLNLGRSLLASIPFSTSIIDVQKRAQQEIDAVIHGMRFPNLGDRAHMPYVQAMVLETLRWHSVAPLGEYSMQPRILLIDIRCTSSCHGRRFCLWSIRGWSSISILDPSRLDYHLQSLVRLTNSSLSESDECRGMLHDANIYHEPFKFNPERHLGESKQLDPRKICFGAGGRRCPGVSFNHTRMFTG